MRRDLDRDDPNSIRDLNPFARYHITLICPRYPSLALLFARALRNRTTLPPFALLHCVSSALSTRPHILFSRLFSIDVSPSHSLFACAIQVSCTVRDRLFFLRERHQILLTFRTRQLFLLPLLSYFFFNFSPLPNIHSRPSMTRSIGTFQRFKHDDVMRATRRQRDFALPPRLYRLPGRTVCGSHCSPAAASVGAATDAPLYPPPPPPRCHCCCRHHRRREPADVDVVGRRRRRRRRRPRRRRHQYHHPPPVPPPPPTPSIEKRPPCCTRPRTRFTSHAY